MGGCPPSALPGLGVLGVLAAQGAPAAAGADPADLLDVDVQQLPGPVAHVVKELSCSPATGYEWLARWHAEVPGGLHDRGSAAHPLPGRTPPEVEEAVLRLRIDRKLGPARIASLVGLAASTVHAVLRRHGRSRVPRRPREPFVRYEWPCPGDLLHMDVKRYPRFVRPGPDFGGGIRHRTTADVHARPGWEFFHAIVDDHSRLAYGELLDDERAATVTAFTCRALAWFDAHGITTRRVMTDGAWTYTNNRALRALLTERNIRHIVTPPYTPRWNGKVERFHQTMEREWAKGLRYRNHHARNAALPHWLAHYNQRRPHSSLGGQSPISRAHNLSGQDT